jgi:hypothetical protein
LPVVVVAPDAYVSRHYLAKFPVIQEIDNWRSVLLDRPALYDADLEDGRELVLHAALAGRATVALMARSASDWWTPVADAGIPVRVIRSRLTALGPVWEAFHV